MPRIACLLLLCLVAVCPAQAETTPHWDALKKGMTPAETFALLGKPLLRSANRGFDLWIYDCGAEVLFFRGPVIAWTKPNTTITVPSASDSFEWPVLWTPPVLPAKPKGQNEPTGLEWLPSSSFLYGQR